MTRRRKNQLLSDTFEKPAVSIPRQLFPLFVLFLSAPGLQAQETEKYGGTTAIKGESTGFFHLEKVNGRHYFITPDGNGFRALGVNHYNGVSSNIPENEDPQPYYDEVIENLTSWGFNSGGYHSPKFLSESLPSPQGISILRTSYWLTRKEHTYEDVFAPSFLEELRERIRRIVVPRKDNPRLVCYFWTDCPVFTNPYMPKGVGVWVEYFKSLPDAASGRKQWEAWRAANPDAEENEFLAVVARHLYRSAHGILRQYDQNHLLFGTRFNEIDMPNYVVREIVPYVDGIAVEPKAAQFDPAFFDGLYRDYGKPIYICDHFGGKELRKAGKPEAFVDYYRKYLTAAMSHPHIVGYNRCQYRSAVPKRNPNFVKEGLLDLDGKPFPGIFPGVTEANRQALRAAYTFND